MNKPLEDKLKALKFRDLKKSEGQNAWNGINARISSRTFPLFTKRKNMIPLLIGVLMFASVGGTVAASNSAVPGDTLFLVDRAVENVRLAFANNGKAELKIKFAEERLGEVATLIARARAQASATTTATTTPSNNATSTATSTSPRKSPDRVALGINVALEYLNDISADLEAKGNTEALAAIESVIDRLEGMVNAEDVRVNLKKDGEFLLKIKGTTASSTASSTGKVKINTSGNKSRIEVKVEDDGRIKIEIKDEGNVRIKSDDDNATSTNDDDNDEDDDDDEDDEDKDNRGRGSVNATGTLRIELDD